MIIFTTRFFFFLFTTRIVQDFQNFNILTIFSSASQSRTLDTVAVSSSLPRFECCGHAYYLTSLEDMTNNEDGQRRKKAQDLLDQYRKASIRAFFTVNTKGKWMAGDSQRFLSSVVLKHRRFSEVD
ncbi:hypothetical protein F8M41_011289 [Gigaspora margarita]|uniref:Uncharacterized protein n=1 Tax=Gigaspora margarita TaxID=4874 RepID=A0A8H3WZK8_GIGMA|nr:hypothetical protein F8M41_011289 [Gigaspora margarita]